METNNSSAVNTSSNQLQTPQDSNGQHQNQLTSDSYYYRDLKRSPLREIMQDTSDQAFENALLEREMGQEWFDIAQDNRREAADHRLKAAELKRNAAVLQAAATIVGTVGGAASGDPATAKMVQELSTAMGSINAAHLNYAAAYKEYEASGSDIAAQNADAGKSNAEASAQRSQSMRDEANQLSRQMINSHNEALKY